MLIFEPMNFRRNIFTRNIREWLTLVVLIFGFFYLSGDSDQKNLKTGVGYHSTEITLLSSDDTEPISNDVSGSENPLEQSCKYIVEANYLGQLGPSDHKLDNDNSQFARQSPNVKIKSHADSKNTLSLVDSELAHQFTLLGEKPSGTS